MIKITNGSVVLTVTRGAFESIYKGMGFFNVNDVPTGLVENNEQHEEPELIEEEVENEDIVEIEGNSDTDFINELIEKPISQWTKAEVKKYTDIKGIDTKGAKSVSDVKEIIKKHMEAEQRAEV